MKDTEQTTTFRRVLKAIKNPLILVGIVAAYIVVSGKLGTCPTCVAITDAVFSPTAEASAQATVQPWSFSTLEGGTLHSDDLKGEVNVVAFWATWCPPCRKEIPALNEIQKQYADKGVNVIGVSVDEDENEALLSKVKKFGIAYPVVRPDETIPELFGSIQSIPTVFIFSRDNEIAFRHVGYTSKKKLEKEIQKLL